MNFKIRRCIILSKKDPDLEFVFECHVMEQAGPGIVGIVLQSLPNRLCSSLGVYTQDYRKLDETVFFCNDKYMKKRETSEYSCESFNLYVSY